MSVARQTSPWGPISTECGPGKQTRSVYCYDLTGDAPVANSFCSGSGAKPPSEQVATKGNCYVWQIGQWSTCSKSVR